MRFWQTKHGYELWLKPEKYDAYQARAKANRDAKQAFDTRDRSARTRSERQRVILKRRHNAASWNKKSGIAQIRHHMIRGRDAGTIAIRMGWCVSDVQSAMEFIRAEGCVQSRDLLDQKSIRLLKWLDYYASRFGSWHLDDDPLTIVWCGKDKPSRHTCAAIKKMVAKAKAHFDALYPRGPGDNNWGLWRAVSTHSKAWRIQ